MINLKFSSLLSSKKKNLKSHYVNHIFRNILVIQFFLLKITVLISVGITLFGVSFPGLTHPNPEFFS